MLLSDASSSHGLFRRLHLDPPLLAGLLALAGLGLVILFSAANQDEALLWKQVTRLAVSFGVMAKRSSSQWVTSRPGRASMLNAR